MTFEEQYFARHYGTHGRNTTRKLRWYVRTALRRVDARPIRHLDVGCGLGDFVAFTSSLPEFVSHGTDVSEHAIAIARQKTPDAQFRASAADAQPWDPNTFDLVTILDVLEHLPDPDQAMISAGTMLDENGVFIAVVPVYDGASGPIIKLLDHDATHINRWGRAAWLNLIGQYFDVLDWTGVFRYGIPRGPYLHFPTRLLRYHSPAILVIGRKKAVPE
ncbi:MAG: class I SAM-dependent methyltransferase [Acidimicrobiia bacterium]|nr:class I SAM-dependent methyltransferase [Acidimicrobiia bacterium]